MKGSGLSAGLAGAADVEINSSSGVTTVKVEGEATDVRNKLHVCILQLAAPSLEDVVADASRPLALAAVRSLLEKPDNGPRILDEVAPGGVPVLIVAPEYTFGSSDWTALNEQITSSSRRLIFVAGFGATAGAKLVQWSEGQLPSVTRRILSWDQKSAPISESRPTNGCWVWTNGFGPKPTCIVSLKNNLEQSLEATALSNLQEGQQILHIRFDDLELFPLICADLLQTADTHKTSVHGRLAQSLEKSSAVKNVLVVGALLQPKQNVNWQIATSNLLNKALHNYSSALVLANIATNSHDPAEKADQWRSISGVYTRLAHIPKPQSQLPASRALTDHDISCAVVRDTTPRAVGGKVGWPPYDPTARFLWHADSSLKISDSGIEQPYREPPSISGTELQRFCLRHPPDKKWCPKLRSGLDELAGYVCSTTPSGEYILSTVLGGVSASVADPDALHDHASALKTGLHGVAILKTAPSFSWQPEPLRMGQLQGQEQHFLIWSDPFRSRGDILSELREWKMKLGGHPPLVVFAQGPLGSPDDQKVELRRRDDFPSPPHAAEPFPVSGSLGDTQSDITQPSSERHVACLKLQHLSDVYAEFDSKTPQDQALLEQALKLAREIF